MNNQKETRSKAGLKSFVYAINNIKKSYAVQRMHWGIRLFMAGFTGLFKEVKQWRLK